ncbi:hypothetical protein E2C01_069747 [Portunus trituberculatus]|uniref:Uncharacterized protein n=1 Tax=Portunus trituberculatus TaxID=210409 RepID=A0A5B7HSD2_PORTR|nr:hypothetical protein [Portunus trituberculatus]
MSQNTLDRGARTVPQSASRGKIENKELSVSGDRVTLSAWKGKSHIVLTHKPWNTPNQMREHQNCC